MLLVDEAWEEAWQIVNSEDGWKEEKKNEHGDVVVSKKSKKGERNKELERYGVLVLYYGIETLASSEVR